MKHYYYSISLSAALLAVAGAASVARAESQRTDINPALTYYQAFGMRPEISNADWDYLSTNAWPGQKLPDRFGPLLGKFDQEFQLGRLAARSTVPCDWGIDWSPGPNTLLPHLSRIKNFGVTARLRAMWALQQGRQTDARDDLLAAAAMARNGASDGSLISTLVQFAVERIICETVAENFNRFSPEILQDIADGLNGPPARGTIAGAMPRETAGFPHWLINKLQELQKQYPGDDAKALEAIRPIFTDINEGPEGSTNRWPQMVAASRGTSAGMIKLLRDMDPFYAKITEIANVPLAQYESQIKDFSAEVENSTNPFVHELLPALEKCRPKEFAMSAELAMVQAAVQYKLHGTTGFQSVADPCGQGPFSFQRFTFDGMDRGFELKSSYTGQAYPTVLIFVEMDGPPFYVDALKAGKPVPQ